MEIDEGCLPEEAIVQEDTLCGSPHNDDSNDSKLNVIDSIDSGSLPSQLLGSQSNVLKKVVDQLDTLLGETSKICTDSTEIDATVVPEGKSGTMESAHTCFSGVMMGLYSSLSTDREISSCETNQMEADIITGVVQSEEKNLVLAETPEESPLANPKPDPLIVFFRRNPKRSASSSQPNLNIDRLTRIVSPLQKSRKDKSIETADPELLNCIARNPDSATKRRNLLMRRDNSHWGLMDNVERVLEESREFYKSKIERDEAEKKNRASKMAEKEKDENKEKEKEKETKTEIEIDHALTQEVSSSSPDSEVYNPNGTAKPLASQDGSALKDKELMKTATAVTDREANRVAGRNESSIKKKEEKKNDADVPWFYKNVNRDKKKEEKPRVLPMATMVTMDNFNKANNGVTVAFSAWNGGYGFCPMMPALPVIPLRTVPMPAKPMESPSYPGPVPLRSVQMPAMPMESPVNRSPVPFRSVPMLVKPTESPVNPSPVPLRSVPMPVNPWESPANPSPVPLRSVPMPEKQLESPANPSPVPLRSVPMAEKQLESPANPAPAPVPSYLAPTPPNRLRPPPVPAYRYPLPPFPLYPVPTQAFRVPKPRPVPAPPQSKPVPAPVKLRRAWACCDDCEKWRCIPAELCDKIDETGCKWTCKENEDKRYADCSAPQEKSNSAINAELEISDGSGDEASSDQPSKSDHMDLDSKPSPQKTLLPADFTLIESNIFLHRSRVTQNVDEIMVCNCKVPQNGGMGCKSQCLNRMLSMECVNGMCPCGDLCSNQQFQRHNYAKLMWFRSGKKGFGLQILENVPTGRFIIEYVGEVLDMRTYEARQIEYAARGQKHFYFMTLDGGEVIDACSKGNLGRFINHSCDPNCRTEKWIVDGEVCIGLFAVRDIKQGEELTFDYNYVRVDGAAAKKCFCGSALCRGYIGGDPLSTELVVQADSDDEEEYVLPDQTIQPVKDSLPVKPAAEFKRSHDLPLNRLKSSFSKPVKVDSLPINPAAEFKRSHDLPLNRLKSSFSKPVKVDSLPINPAAEFKRPQDVPLDRMKPVKPLIVFKVDSAEGTSFSKPVKEDILPVKPTTEFKRPQDVPLNGLKPVKSLDAPRMSSGGEVDLRRTRSSSSADDTPPLDFLNTQSKGKLSSKCSDRTKLGNAGPEPESDKGLHDVKPRRGRLVKIADKLALSKDSHVIKKREFKSILGDNKNHEEKVKKLFPGVDERLPKLSDEASGSKRDKEARKESKSNLGENKKREEKAKKLFERVDETLPKLLDEGGGVRRDTDARKVYLELLSVTVTAGENGTTQRAGDLLMLLDAILKTQSYTVLNDIMHDNGVDMLHSMLKQNRENFIRTPVIRKLLKVFDTLAEKNIWTLEQMNKYPACRGAERFRDAIFNLITNHKDNQVHQLAKAFFNKYMPKHMRYTLEPTPDRHSSGFTPLKRKSRWDHPDPNPQNRYVVPEPVPSPAKKLCTESVDIEEAGRRERYRSGTDVSQGVSSRTARNCVGPSNRFRSFPPRPRGGERVSCDVDKKRRREEPSANSERKRRRNFVSRWDV